MFVVSVLLIGVFLPPTALPPQGSSAAIHACAILTRDVVEKAGTTTKQLLDVVKPVEEPLGTLGSACHYGGITLQIDPFTAERLEQLHKQSGKDWLPQSAVGDGAYFH